MIASLDQQIRAVMKDMHAETGLSVPQLAAEMGVGKDVLYRMLSGKVAFYVRLAAFSAACARISAAIEAKEGDRR